MCLSPFDAALHDAAGQALQCSAFDLYQDDQPLVMADAWLGGNGCGAIRRMLQPPLKSLPAWILVGKDDDLERDMRPWVDQRGYHCFKIKIMGRDNAVDVARTIAVFRAARQFGVAAPRISVDSNEANPTAASVLEYLLRLRAEAPDAFAALQYLEQPTGRDIRKADYDWSAVSALKPVLLDEGLTSLELMAESRRQGWTGFALKTCKGHSFALLAAAWATGQGMKLAMQDLTNPGYSFLHAALFAARLPTLNGVELNSPQFTPAANHPWLPRLAPLFEPKDGYHHLPETIPLGLGSGL
jgi:L-alanine-DL-glutamate epimerase-like enolase superfamily enzyme